MVLTALMIFVLMGMAALSVDVGLAVHERRDIQNAADAAALAGVQEMALNPSCNGGVLDASKAIAKAQEWAKNNGIEDSELESVQVLSTDCTNDSVEVKVKRDSNYTFGRVLGLTSAKIKAKAKAQAGSLTGATGLTPFGVLDTAINYCTWNQIIQSPPLPLCITTLKYNVNDVGANIGDLDFDGKGGGANELNEKIKGGNKDPLCSINETPPPGCETQEPSKTGNSTGQIRDAINWRLNNTTSECDSITEVVGFINGQLKVLPQCNPWGEAAGPDTDGDFGTCDNINWNGSQRGSCRIIALPIIQNVNGQLPPPSQNATNVGFALFWLLPLVNGTCSGNNCEILGIFIDAQVSVSGLLGKFDPDNTPFVVGKLIE
ncbi:MAG TPA: Tad domain-containing protein [Dehalococcoidia bacterium]|nr:Tad domain-containing protein [Dehalococcoidia bacterium]